MFNKMSTFDNEGETIQVGRQNFGNGTVPAKSGDNIIDCPMYISEDGDIFFEFENKHIYFSDLKC